MATSGLDMAEHTPGPWTATDDRRGIWEIIHDGELLADVWSHGSAARDLPAEANARLIAAAPELLEACKRFVEWDEYVSSLDVPTSLRKVMDTVIASADSGKKP